jgi:ferric-dicitrate binding protein FerR (iron transport regulator)
MTATNDTAGEAAAWLIRLEGQTTPQMWDEFQGWIESDRRNQAAFIRLRTAWTQGKSLSNARRARARSRPLLISTYFGIRRQSSTSGCDSSGIVRSG